MPSPDSITNSAAAVSGTISLSVSENPSGTVLATYQYHYDGSEVAVEYQPSATWTYYLGLGIDQKVMRVNGTTKQWYYQDALGSVSAVADNSGNVLEQYEYNAQGQFQITNASGTVLTGTAIANNILFTGREYDAETGNYFYRARYYNPTLGRFISRDPLSGAEFSQGTNLYAYCGNNYLNATDPNGQFAIGAVVGGVLGGITGAVGAYMTTGSIGDAVVGGLIGAATGALVGALDPSEGLLTSDIILTGATAAAAGDLAGQLYANGGDPDQVSYGEVIGSGIAGAASTAIGLEFGAATITDAVAGGTATLPLTLGLPAVGGELLPGQSPSSGDGSAQAPFITAHPMGQTACGRP